MSDETRPNLYLITPPEVDLETFPNALQSVLDATEVACLRLSLSTQDEGLICKTGDLLREIAHARDIPLVMDSHVVLAERLGLDGVHLPDGGRGLRKLRADLGEDAIIGAHCGTSRHDGMSAGEAGADYIAFGPTTATAIGDGAFAEDELFAWWSEMIELPVVAEGALTPDRVAQLAPITDFFAIGSEIWSEPDPVLALKTLIAPLDG